VTWEHKPDRVPQLDRKDLQTISLLVEEYGKKHIPIFSKRLMMKVEESMEAYRIEDDLLRRAEKNESRRNKNGAL
jgi:hypothetical protein